MILKFTYKERPFVYCGEEKIVYTSTLLNDDMTTLTLQQHVSNLNDSIYNIESNNIKEIFIKNKTIWNLLHEGDLVQRKLGYNLYKNTLIQ